MKKLTGLAAWLPTKTYVYYCPKHDSINTGFFCHCCNDTEYVCTLESNYIEHIEEQLEIVENILEYIESKNKH